MFKLIADPTFEAEVQVPRPGQEAVPLKLVYRHRARDELKAWVESLKGRLDDETVPEIVVGWHDVDAEFSKEALLQLLQQYPLAGQPIIERYLLEEAGIRQKND